MGSEDNRPARRQSELAIADAKQRVDDRVSHYVAMHQMTGEGSAELEQARRSLHVAVLDYHHRLKNHSRSSVYWDPDEKDFEDEDTPINEPLWTGAHPVLGEITINGLADLNDWRDKTVMQDVSLPGPKHGRDTRAVEVRLPASALLRLADVLNKVYEDCGWDAEQAVTEYWE